MPRLDAHHEIVKRALVRDGWTITDDPLVLDYQDITLYADLGAERTIGAEKGGQKIAVEIKVFGKGSHTNQLHTAKGQYDFYKFILERIEPERALYLALPRLVWKKYFQRPAVLEFVTVQQLKIVIYDVKTEELCQWIN